MNHLNGPWHIEIRETYARIYDGINNTLFKFYRNPKWTDNQWKKEIDDLTLMSHARSIPHQCDDPACPGNIIRQKLELFNELVECLECVIEDRVYSGMPSDLIDRAHTLQETM